MVRALERRKLPSAGERDEAEVYPSRGRAAVGAGGRERERGYGVVFTRHGCRWSAVPPLLAPSSFSLECWPPVLYSTRLLCIVGPIERAQSTPGRESTRAVNSLSHSLSLSSQRQFGIRRIFSLLFFSFPFFHSSLPPDRLPRDTCRCRRPMCVCARARGSTRRISNTRRVDRSSRRG